MATKKRSDAGDAPKPTQRKTGTKTASRPKAADAGEKSAVKAAVKAGAKKAARPRLRASHSSPEVGEGQGARRIAARPKPSAGLGAKGATRKAPLAAPKRAVARKQPPAEAASSAARELAITISAAGLEKKALGVEILDVRGRVDYADFLVIMTGRSDRHVAAIAQGIEEELGKKKAEPISVEGMSQATWVLLDYADVVVHVFQEDARQLYDIEGLWMDASRVSVPGAQQEGDVRSAASQALPQGEEDEEDEEAEEDED